MTTKIRQRSKAISPRFSDISTGDMLHTPDSGLLFSYNDWLPKY